MKKRKDLTRDELLELQRRERHEIQADIRRLLKKIMSCTSLNDGDDEAKQEACGWIMLSRPAVKDINGK
jgi:hypothetical protein